MGLRPILTLLKLLLALIRLGKRLKPSKKLYALLPRIYKFRVGLKLVSFGLQTCRPKKRRKREGGGEKKRVRKREKKKKGKEGKAGEVLKEGKKDKGEDMKKNKRGRKKIKTISLL